MALRGMAYSVRMAAYNADGGRVTGLSSTLTATLWADGVTTTLTGITITEIGSTGVYVVPLTAGQMTAYNLCITATSSTAGITFDPVYLDTEAGRIDVATSTRLAASGYTTPPTVADIQSGLAKTSELPSVPTVSDVVTGVWSADARTITGGSLTIEPPTAETIAESVWTRSSRLITGGAPTAVSIASAVWSADTRTITATPVYNGPTVEEIADGVVPLVLGTDVLSIENAEVGSLKTLFLLQTNAKIVAEKLVVYETDGVTIHTQYDVVSTSDQVDPVIGIGITGA